MKNWINRHDFVDGLAILKRNSSLFRRLAATKNQRVVQNWSGYEIPADRLTIIDHRVNTLVSGRSDVSRFEYTAKKHLSSARLIAASLGCGNGIHDITWAKQGVFSKIIGIDITPSRIAEAIENAKRQGMSDVCEFQCGDFKDVLVVENQFDVVIFESSLHHFHPLPELMKLVRHALKDHGLILLFDYVGPTKWQWFPRQLEIVNAMLSILPERYRTLQDGSTLKRRTRPSLLRMHLMDPSEAIDSENILVNLRSHFEELELKNAGGALLYHLFPRLQHNFDPESESDIRWLKCLIEIEDLWLEDVDSISMWYCYAVYKNRK